MFRNRIHQGANRATEWIELAEFSLGEAEKLGA